MQFSACQWVGLFALARNSWCDTFFKLATSTNAIQPAFVCALGMYGAAAAVRTPFAQHVLIYTPDRPIHEH